MFNSTKSAAELEAQRVQLLDRADEIARLREGANGRDLTADEKLEFDKLTETGGEIDQAAEAVDRQHRVEATRDARRAAKLGAASVSHDRVFGPHKERTARVEVKENRSGVVKDPMLARLTGCFFRAVENGDKAGAARDELGRLGYSEWATMTEGQPTQGGFAVPAPVSSEIVRIRDEVAVIPQLARTWEMTSETLHVPRELSRPTVYYPGEANTITPSDASLQRHSLTAKKRAVLVRASNEVLADSAGAFGEWLLEASAYALAEKLDAESLNGDATSLYGGVHGLISAIGAAGVNDADSGEDTLSELDATDWTDTIGLLPGKYHRGAAWIMSRQVWNGSCLPIMATAGGAGFASIMSGAAGQRPNWFGYPVYFSDLMPTAAASTIVALFGDFRSGLYLGDRGDMSVATSTEEKFAEDLVSFKLTHRYDLLVAEPGDDTTVGAYTALKLAAGG